MHMILGSPTKLPEAVEHGEGQASKQLEEQIAGTQHHGTAEIEAAENCRRFSDRVSETSKPTTEQPPHKSALF